MLLYYENYHHNYFHFASSLVSFSLKGDIDGRCHLP